ncbi:helix-turn-helix domain-containing protein [Streptococcus chenjunshii]|uniref:Helix-turn-helix domain-containing protein n=1 Tax=Streptococcus chenjunshii TaxID=2173853 RepID=A0A372KQD3_9STRE|nr:helix-turn-helix domain-containing protein [Streptococcus chenjunshii]AXQ77987.1 helix-turn-helix domain-containing protein [Streptococcus chenjunshii]RFU51768.1 helix-turn-helix domain-containing protein [Streptococcus chenjunshii]RFU53858.1 helix-turn-helix domain-containing protein [Streptococcus chenjunshii]
MIDKNIKLLRKKQGLSQEKLAEKIGVSRQTVAKWETGNSLPDVLSCAKLAELFDVSIEDLLHLDTELLSLPHTKGKYIFGSLTVQEGGQISLPARARKLFSIEPGDDLLLIGDVDRGLALVDVNFFLESYRALEINEKDS